MEGAAGFTVCVDDTLPPELKCKREESKAAIFFPDVSVEDLGTMC